MAARSPEHAPDQWDEEIEVLVVGSGFAGLAAAAEAAGLGARVVVLEKRRQYGGNSLISGGGYCAWDSRSHLRQKLGLGDDSWQLHLQDTIKGGDYYGLPDLVEVMVRLAPEGLNWLIDAGVRFLETLPRIGGHSAHRIHIADGLGPGLIRPLQQMALKRGATIRLNTRVASIWRKDQEGPVAGVTIVQAGKQMNIKVRRALVLAAGGFCSDLEMRMAVNPRLVSTYGCTNHRQATGEIIQYARAIGADVLHLEFIQLYPCANPKNGAIDPYALHPYSGTGFGVFYVDRTGKRFVNELDRRDVVSDAQIKSKQKPTYAILNSEIFTKLAASLVEIRRGVAKKRIIAASTVAGLAICLNIDPQALQDTVEKHNSFISLGKDPDFNKPMTNQMIPLETGPFYAIAQWPAIHHCMGGLRIDKQARVIDIWGLPIPGLYAAGEVCGGIHGANRLGGNAIAECIVFGRIAGMKAAQDPID